MIGVASKATTTTTTTFVEDLLCAESSIETAGCPLSVGIVSHSLENFIRTRRVVDQEKKVLPDRVDQLCFTVAVFLETEQELAHDTRL